MAKPVTTKGGLLRILLGSGSGPIVYAAPCGLMSKSLTLTKGLEEFNIGDCDAPTALDWIGRDAVSLSMSVSGEGVVAQQSIQTWLDAWNSPDSIPVKAELEFPDTTITWTGNMHVESVELGAPNNTGRVTGNFSLQSDGEMAQTSANS